VRRFFYACGIVRRRIHRSGDGGMIVGGAGGILWPVLVAFFASIAAFVVRFYKNILSWARGLWKGKP